MMTARIPLLGGLLVVGAICLAGCAKDAPPTDKPAPEVTVSQPVAREVTDYFEFPGCTEAVSEVEIRARVTGYIMKVNFEDGQEVKACQVLFEIDPRPYEAALDKAKGELALLEATQEKAEADLARSERLRPSGAISQDEYEQNVAKLKQAKAGIASAKAAVAQAALDLEFTKIVSPIDGRVSKARIREGNLVQSGGNNSAVLTTVVTTDPIYVYFNVDEHRSAEVPGTCPTVGPRSSPEPAEGSEAARRDRPGQRRGISARGHSSTSPTTRSTARRARSASVACFTNDDGYLTPGLFVRVRVPVGQPHRRCW